METWTWRHEEWTWRHGHGDNDTWRSGHIETWTWRQDKDMETWTWRHTHGDMDMETWTWRHGIKILGNAEVSQKKIKWEVENRSQAIFLYPFPLCSSCKRKFVVCPFVCKETNGSCPLANGLNVLNGLSRLNGLAHLWVSLCIELY